MTTENDWQKALTEGERRQYRAWQKGLLCLATELPAEVFNSFVDLSEDTNIIIKRLGGEVVELRDEAGYNPDGSNRTDQDYADFFGQTLEEYQTEAKATAERFKKKLPLMIELAEKNRNIKKLEAENERMKGELEETQYIRDDLEESVQMRLDEMNIEATTFDKDLWKSLRPLLPEFGLDWRDFPDGVTASDVEGLLLEHIEAIKERRTQGET